jgi:antagonist of KipI
MADAQTTGGYPRIARICAADLSLLAQCRPGVKIQFKEIGEEESEIRCKKTEKYLRLIKLNLMG